MTAILGISAFYHDSAAALVVDGRVVAAAQEERFSRKKHDDAMPSSAIEFCLRQAGLSARDVDFVAFYEKPILKFERLLQTYRTVAPAGYGSFRRAIRLWMKDKVHVRKRLRKELKGFDGKLVFTEHHESHAASAFFPSPFDEAAILTLDGVGEWATGCLGSGSGNKVALTDELRFPHSLGLLYSAFTAYCGFRVNNGEYKLMGLAPFGEPKFRGEILEELLDLKEDGSFRMDMSYFDYCRGLRMTSRKFHETFGGQPRKADSEIDQRIKDLAASVQAATEEVVLRMAKHLHGQTGMRNLVMAGGVALNCVANARVAKDGPFEDVWVQPSAGDAGGALGAALFVWHQLLEKPRDTNGAASTGRAGGVRLGPEYSDAEIESCLKASSAEYAACDADDALCDQVATLLEQQKVVGWFQGRMEFSPRALGSRSILADPRRAEMQSTLNDKIKFRESFRPFAPSVLREHMAKWFDVEKSFDSPYMTFVAPVQSSRRPDVPAVTHVDGSARVQSVDQARHPLFHRLLSRFCEKTGCPMLANTSFNVRGEPIVCSPEDALRCFLMTDMDALVLGRHVLLKKSQNQLPTEQERLAYRDEFRKTSGSSSLFSDVDWNPDRRRLLLFGFMCLGMLLVLGWFWGAGPTVMSGLGGAGFGILALAYAVPEAIKPLYVGLNVLAAPLQWLVKEVALLVVYGLAFVPMAVWLKIRKRDVLNMKWDKEADSYWASRSEKDVASYYRQF